MLHLLMLCMCGRQRRWGPRSGPSQSPALPDAVACEMRCAYVWLGHASLAKHRGTPLREQMLQMHMQHPPSSS